MATKYKLNITDAHLVELNDDSDMDGVTLEATSDDGNRVMVTLVKSDTVNPQKTETQEVDTIENSDEEVIGNVSPEEEAAMETEKAGFTNESRVNSFDQFLKS